TQNIEPAYRLHLHVSDDDLRIDGLHLFDRFGSGVEWENLMPFIATESHDHFHHCRFVVDDDDLGHILRAEIISQMRKGKAKMRNHAGVITLPASIIHGTGSSQEMIAV